MGCKWTKIPTTAKRSNRQAEFTFFLGIGCGAGGEETGCYQKKGWYRHERVNLKIKQNKTKQNKNKKQKKQKQKTNRNRTTKMLQTYKYQADASLSRN